MQKRGKNVEEKAKNEKGGEGIERRRWRKREETRGEQEECRMQYKQKEEK